MTESEDFPDAEWKSVRIIERPKETDLLRYEQLLQAVREKTFVVLACRFQTFVIQDQ